MTIASDVIKSGPYTGNASTTSFDYNFKIFANADLRVVRTVIATGVETDLTLDVDYTVAGAGDESGGSISYPVSGSPLPATETITIVSDITIEQQTDLSNQGGFYSEVHESAFDRLCRFSQQLAEKLSRAIVVEISSTDTPEGLIAELRAVAIAAAASAAAAAQSYLDFDNRYLGSHSSAPSTLNDSTPLDASHEGIEYWNSTSKNRWTWNGGTLSWGLTSSSVATSANNVSVSDSGGYFSDNDVEAVLQKAVREPNSFTVSGSAATSITVGGLSFDANKDIEFELFAVPGLIATSHLQIVLNGDATATNYYSIYSTNSGAAVQANNAQIGANNVGNNVDLHVSGVISPNSITGESIVTINLSYWDSVNLNMIQSSIRYTVSDVITSVGFRENIGAVQAFGIGSRLTVREK